MSIYIIDEQSIDNHEKDKKREIRNKQSFQNYDFSGTYFAMSRDLLKEPRPPCLSDDLQSELPPELYFLRWKEGQKITKVDGEIMPAFPRLDIPRIYTMHNGKFAVDKLELFGWEDEPTYYECIDWLIVMTVLRHHFPKGYMLIGAKLWAIYDFLKANPSEYEKLLKPKNVTLLYLIKTLFS